MGEDLEQIQDKQFMLTFPGKYQFKIGKKKYLIVESR